MLKYRYYLIFQNIYLQPVGDYIEIYLNADELQQQKDAGRVLFKTEAEVFEYFEREGIEKNMQYLKATTTDGKTEYFNANNILTITPLANGNIKILMGAGLYYQVKPESLTLINNIMEELQK